MTDPKPETPCFNFTPLAQSPHICRFCGRDYSLHMSGQPVAPAAAPREVYSTSRTVPFPPGVLEQYHRPLAEVMEQVEAAAPRPEPKIEIKIGGKRQDDTGSPARPDPDLRARLAARLTDEVIAAIPDYVVCESFEDIRVAALDAVLLVVAEEIAKRLASIEAQLTEDTWYPKLACLDDYYTPVNSYQTCKDATITAIRVVTKETNQKAQKCDHLFLCGVCTKCGVKVK